MRIFRIRPADRHNRYVCILCTFWIGQSGTYRQGVLSPWCPIYGKENPEQLYGRALQTDGNLLVSGKQGRMLESLVYETNWKLERCPRIHKRILCTLHLQSKSGNFCIIYIYSDNGPIPKVIKEEEVKAQIPIQVKIRNLSRKF
ncbi:hypothetical protein L3Y34_013597 [Caenorhabditis briggsae]|uniref:DUF7747 domain-containing protein n=1 Tax=Caenorhabditis briggsae TaxID=6238 RepID=A0AAE8ZXC7_CAEBR|nr:hypothetical protein L3Y34_013597 [Caenorhabditis briggsae]